MAGTGGLSSERVVTTGSASQSSTCIGTVHAETTP
jgi:hypothetical protein